MPSTSILIRSTAGNVNRSRVTSGTYSVLVGVYAPMLIELLELLRAKLYAAELIGAR